MTEPAAHSDPGLGGASAPADRSLGPGPFPLSLVVAPPGLEASAPLFVIPAGPDLPRLLVSSCSATTFSSENMLRGTCAEKVLRDAAATACCPGPAAAGLPLRPEPLSVDKSGLIPRRSATVGTLLCRQGRPGGQGPASGCARPSGPATHVCASPHCRPLRRAAGAGRGRCGVPVPRAGPHRPRDRGCRALFSGRVCRGQRTQVCGNRETFS